MSTDLIDYLYLEAKEKAFEQEIESRKDFEFKRGQILKERKEALREIYENEDRQKNTEFRQ